MESELLENSIIEKYLSLINVQQKKPSLKGLNEIVMNHMLKIPFENLSKIYQKKKLGFTFMPDIQTYLEGIERNNFGGTCYANNYYLYRLLISLGYNSKLCGADMTNPDVHIAVNVKIKGSNYLIDTGYGAPFMKPMPLDSTDDYSINMGDDKFVLKSKDENGYSKMELWRSRELKHGYILKPEPRKFEEFKSIIEKSYSDDALFQNALLMVKFYSNSRIIIHNFSLIKQKPVESETAELKSKQKLTETILKYFLMPENIVSDVVNGLNEFRNAWD